MNEDIILILLEYIDKKIDDEITRETEGYASAFTDNNKRKELEKLKQELIDSATILSDKEAFLKVIKELQSEGKI